MWTRSGRDKFDALVGVLRQEYAALGWLAFKLSQTELLTHSREARFLPMIVDEVDEIADELGMIEVARAMIVDELCEALGYSDDARTLSELIEEAPEDLAPVLADLRSKLLELLDGMASAATRGSEFARAHLGTIQNALDNIDPAAPGDTGYNQWGSRPVAAAGATRFDTAL